jgi:uncharacterized protein YndB with AHSA1/START domain
MGSYAFLSLWVIDAPIDEVWEVISNADEYPSWWRYVDYTREIEHGDDDGVGQKVRSKWSSALPYGFEFETEVARIEKPTTIELVSHGELEGSGTWELSTTHAGTAVRYYWRVRTTRLLMDLLGPVARPAFAWNHAVIMRAGGEGLAQRLSSQLIRNESFASESANLVFPLLTICGIVIGATSLPLAVLRRAGQRRK